MLAGRILGPAGVFMLATVLVSYQIFFVLFGLHNHRRSDIWWALLAVLLIILAYLVALPVGSLLHWHKSWRWITVPLFAAGAYPSVNLFMVLAVWLGLGGVVPTHIPTCSITRKRWSFSHMAIPG